MKRLKECLDFLISLAKAWPIIISILFVIVAAITRFSKFANQSLSFSLPLWAIILIVALTIYPLGKMIQFIASRRKAPLRQLNGLLWKIPIFGSPIAICPRKGCGCEVICKEIPPAPFKYVATVADIHNARFEHIYEYECPVHGGLDGIPNEQISLLSKKAKLAFKG